MSDERIIEKLDELIATQKATTIPLRDRWLDAKGVAALLSQEPRYVLERLAPRPDFPKPLREGQPRWKASEILEWADERRQLMQRCRELKRVA